MKRLHFYCISLLSLAAMQLRAQEVKVEFYTPSVVRITKTPDNKPVDKQSLVVTAKPANVKVKTENAQGSTTYTTSDLIVKVTHKNSNQGTDVVQFYSRKGEELLAEGECKFTPITSGIDAGAYKVRQGWTLDSDEPIYGLGMLQNGKMNQREENRNMMQSNLEDYTHFFQSIKGYGIYWDNYSPTDISDKKELALESHVGKMVDYYFMYGKNADGVIHQLRNLTGHVPMLPLWTYGFHQSRERYKSQQELLEVVRKYRQLGVPFDGIIQDWQYWGSNYTWNAMEFINDSFDQAQKMIDEVHQKNAHISISIWQSFGPKTKQYKELDEKGLLFDFETWPQSGLPFWPPRMDYPSGVRVYDAYSPVARDIYWKYLSHMHQMGIDGWWMDSTDPDHHSYKDSDLDERCTLGSYRSVRNMFPFFCVKGVDEHQRQADQQKRVFILTRSFFTGMQRFGANTWSGDVNSSWDSFRKQVPLVLNATLCGTPHVNTDIGGFFANSYNRSYMDNSACKNPQYQELYVRWMQFGLFNPMMRSHGTEVFRELYHFGKSGEPVYDALLSAVEMRYQLMPYIYSTSWQVSHNDDSFMRALIMDFQQDKQVWNNNRQFMFGRNLLVCPVVNALFTQEKIVKSDAMTGWNRKDNNEYANGWPRVNWAEKKTYEVYLPSGTQWYDFWTGTRYEGGQKLQADAPLAHSPLYAKAGAIIPIGQKMQYTHEKPWDNITLRVFPGHDGTFTLYEDEGDNYNYQNGQYTEIDMQWNDKARTLTLAARKGTYSGMLTTRTFVIQLPDGTTKNVQYNGKKLQVKM